MADNVAIKVEHVSKVFKLPSEKNTSLKSVLINFSGRKTYELQEALKDISFEVKNGEFFGIVGRNGSGKSTLLKLLAGIYTPSSGSVEINGKLTPFIELGVGFNPELTGRENVYLNGALLGFSRHEMQEMYKDIVGFAELDRFMDQKLKNYSSGMQVRLAFSIAIRAKSDILLIDEVLAVGDENFQRKCYDYFSRIKKEGKTVVFVSHDMDAVKDYCDRAILINEGNLIMDGPGSKVVTKYSELNFKVLANGNEPEDVNEQMRRWGNGEATIEKVWTSLGDKRRNAFTPDEKISVHIDITAHARLEQPVIGMILQDAQGRTVFATNTKELNKRLKPIYRGEKVEAVFQIDNIYTNGSYTVSCAIASFDRTTVFSRIEDAHKLVISGWSRAMAHSIAHPKHSFELLNK